MKKRCKKERIKWNLKEKNNLILFLLFCFFTLSLTVGYAAINQNFKISGEGVFKPTKDCGIINVSLLETSNVGLESYKSTYTTDTISLGVDLKQLNSTITYKVTVYNSGTLAMWIDSIIQEVNNNTNMEYVLNGIGVRELINPGEIREFTITIKYKKGVSLPSNTNLVTKLKFNFINPVSTLASNIDYIAYGQYAPLFNGPITRMEVQSITFVPTLDISDYAIDVWDASQDGDGTVLAWYTDEDGNGLYEVTVGGAGGVFAPEESDVLLAFLNEATEINFNGCFNMMNALSVAGLFIEDNALTSLDLSNLNTSGVEEFGLMFYDCSALEEINFNNFETESATSMVSMFYNCDSLRELDLRSFNTSNVTTMEGMFEYCSNLSSIDISSFNTSKVVGTGMKNMFYECASLLSLDLSNFDTSKITDMSNMFFFCSRLNKLLVDKFNTSNVTNMESMFSNCSSLTSLNVSGFNTGNVTNMSSMFSGCSKVLVLPVDGFNTAKVKNMSSMFKNCSSLTNLNLDNFAADNVTNMSSMFNGCSKLTGLKLTHLNTSNVTNMSYMFYKCSSLTELIFTNSINIKFKTNKVTDFSYMFAECTSLKSINGLISCDVAKNLSHMFYNCKSFNTYAGDSSLGSLIITFPENATDMSYMYAGCESMTKLDGRTFDFTSLQNYEGMFEGKHPELTILLNSDQTLLEQLFYIIDPELQFEYT